MLRHEQQPIAMALGAHHHSAGPWEKKKVEMQQNAALQGQTTGNRAREEVVNATHDAPRGHRAAPERPLPASLRRAHPPNPLPWGVG